MTDFIKQWITSTLVPESIQNIRTSKYSSLDAIVNEDGSIKVFVISHYLKDNGIQIGSTPFKASISNISYTSMEAVNKVAELLNLTNIKT